MFELSTKIHYGVAALLDLAIAYDKDLVQIKEIVEKREISKSYLEQLFNRLTKFGIVKSVRGNRGGYMLAKPPSQFTLLEIFEILEGPLELSTDRGLAVLSPLFLEIQADIRSRLSLTLSELLEKELVAEGVLMYYI